MLNNKLSVRGSIRRSNNIIQMVYVVKNLMSDQSLTDITMYIRAFNQQMSREHQIVGKSAMALKLLFGTCTSDTLTMILDYVQAEGWGSSCWGTETLANKKMYPNHQFSSKSKKWVPRIKTSDESMKLMVTLCQRMGSTQQVHMKKKLDVSMQDAMSERAAALLVTC